MIMEFRLVDGVQFFLVTSICVSGFATPVVNCVAPHACR